VMGVHGLMATATVSSAESPGKAPPKEQLTGRTENLTPKAAVPKACVESWLFRFPSNRAVLATNVARGSRPEARVASRKTERTNEGQNSLRGAHRPLRRVGHSAGLAGRRRGHGPLLQRRRRGQLGSGR